MKWIVAVRWSLDSSMLPISGQPTAHMGQLDAGGSVAHFQVAMKSSIVRGDPSDHLRLGLRVTLTSRLEPLTTTPPLAGVGTATARSGMYLPSDVMATKPRITGRIASMAESREVEAHRSRVVGAPSSPITTVPVGTVLAGSFGA